MNFWLSINSSYTEVSLSWYSDGIRFPKPTNFSFRQLSCLQIIFITCDGLFGFKLFVLVSGPLTKYPNIDFCATNAQLLLRFISPVTNSQYVTDPINKSILVLSECPWLVNCKFCKNPYFSTANLYDYFFTLVDIFGIPNEVITFLWPVHSELTTTSYSFNFIFDSFAFKNTLTLISTWRKVFSLSSLQLDLI